MKLLGIFSFEFRYQIRRAWPWLSAAVLLVFAFFNTRIAVLPVTLPQDFVLNSPFIIAVVSVFSCQIWLLTGPAVAGEAGARDVHTGMHPLLYTSSITRTDYVIGRFLAAFVINSLVLLSVQVGSLLAVYGPGANPDIVATIKATKIRAQAKILVGRALDCHDFADSRLYDPTFQHKFRKVKKGTAAQGGETP
jgi:ABC-type transport system involved in multi-copper enzyme maturation permease subunit